MGIIKNTPYGQISFCKCKNLYSLEFGNIYLYLTRDELLSFRNYVFSINHKHYLNINSNARNIRKLMLNIGHSALFFSLHEYEFLELKELLSFEYINKENMFTDVRNMNINLN